MPNNGGPEASGSGSASSLRPRRRTGSSDPVLIVCRCFSVVTAVAALLCVTDIVLSAVYSFRGRVDIMGGVFWCYAVASWTHYQGYRRPPYSARD